MSFPDSNFLDFDIILPYIRFISILIIPVGILLLLYGYKLFRFFLAFIGFFIGFGIGAVSDQVILIGLLGGILGALILYALYKVGIFFLGMIVGGFIALILMAMTEEMQPGFLLVLAVGGGFFALIIEKAIIIFFSSYHGASIVISGLSWLLLPEYQLRIYSRIFTDLESYLGLVSTQMFLSLILMVVGILYQYGKIPHKVDQYLPKKLQKRVADQRDTNSIHYRHKPESASGISPEESVSTNSITADSSPSPVPIAETFEAFYNSLKVWLNHFISNTKRITRKILESLLESFRRPPSSNEIHNKNTSATSFDQLVSSENYLEFPIQLKIKDDYTTLFVDSIVGVNQGGYHTATFGRAYADNSHHIQIKDPERHISRFHGEFALKEGVCYVRRLSDVNPLWLNGEEIGKNVFKPLNQGDVIQTGNVQMVII